MGTFIVAFIGNSFVASAADAVLWLAPDNPPLRRRALVLVYFCLIVALITLFGVLTIPDIAREGADFVSRLKSDNVWVILVEKTRQGLGDQVAESAERFVYLATSTDITRAAADVSQAAARGDWSPERSVRLGLAVSSMLKGYTTTAAAVVSAALRSVTKFAIQVGVSLVLGFFLLWDLPAITAGVSSLQRSRLAPVYAEVAPVLSVFGRLFGKALEAQARIAAVNTALTAVGMWALAIPGVGLLSLFCFVCSFIPIAGVVISTTPIGFVALTEYGFTKLALVILMVTAVHFCEAYMLNPAIYSAHLKLHPLMVLSALVVAEHNAGVWGLLLAVPGTVFALDYLIRYPESSVTEVGEKELEKVSRRAEEEGGSSEEEALALAAAAAGVGGAAEEGAADGAAAAAGGARSAEEDEDGEDEAAGAAARQEGGGGQPAPAA